MTTTHVQSPKTTRFEIIGGPGVSDLLDALKYAFSKTQPFQATFHTVNRIEGSRISVERILKAQVIGIEYESGAPGMFIVTMNIAYLRGKPRQVKAYYNTVRRTGGFSVED